MVKNKKMLWVSFFLFLLASQNVIFGQETRVYHEFEPQTLLDSEKHTLYQLGDDFFVYEDWREIENSNEKFLFGVIKEGKNFRQIYQSRGEADSFYLRLSFFKTNQKTDPLIILGEIGTEYSWGIHVLLVEDHLIKDIGYLNVGAELKFENGDTVISAVPYTKITTDGKEFRFTFTKDMIYEDSDFYLVKKENIYYIYTDGNLKEILKK